MSYQTVEKSGSWPSSPLSAGPSAKPAVWRRAQSALRAALPGKPLLPPAKDAAYLPGVSGPRTRVSPLWGFTHIVHRWQSYSHHQSL